MPCPLYYSNARPFYYNRCQPPFTMTYTRSLLPRHMPAPFNMTYTRSLPLPRHMPGHFVSSLYHDIYQITATKTYARIYVSSLYYDIYMITSSKTFARSFYHDRYQTPTPPALLRHMVDIFSFHNLPCHFPMILPYTYSLC